MGDYATTGRRRFLQGLAAGACTLSGGRLLAEELLATPPQTEGPFYPNRLPLDTDNDLLHVNDESTQARGETTHLTGRVLSAAGSPLRNVDVEIWQVDANGIYLHTGDPNRKQRDEHFQGFGRFLTNRKGEYYFRTIKPVSYDTGGVFRTPHIHVAVNKGDRRLLTTQLYVNGHPLNSRDGILRRLDEKQRAAVLVDFEPIDDGQLTANFDIVLGHTPEDRET